jgi:hypothetical protein
VDAALAALSPVDLARTPAGVFLQTGCETRQLERALALVGVGVEPCGQLPSAATGLLVAVGVDLEPIDRLLGAVDVLHVSTVPIGEATAVLLRRTFRWLRPSAVKRERCRRLLHEEDVVLGWRRVVWCTRRDMRSAALRQHARPVVFDRGALERARPRWSVASDGAIGRWLFA